MFAPDIFADPAIHAASVPFTEAAGLIARAGAAFSDLGEVVAVESLGGARINSRNFLLRTAAGPNKVLKLVCPAEAPVLEAGLQLSAWLLDRGLPFPRPYPASSGRLVFEDAELEGLALIEAVEGHHYNGDPDALGPLGALLSRLREQLQSVPEPLHPSSTIPLAGEPERALLDRLAAHPERWAHWLGPETAALYADAVLRIEAALDEVDRLRRERLRFSPCHIDVHPHNLVFQGPKLVAVLDPASLRVGPLEVMEAFGALKVLRHSVAMHQVDGPSEIARRVEALLGPRDLSRVGALARAEVLRRIFVLLRLSIEDGDRSWNHVLPVHLSALAESRQLFGGSA